MVSLSPDPLPLTPLPGTLLGAIVPAKRRNLRKPDSLLVEVRSLSSSLISRAKCFSYAKTETRIYDTDWNRRMPRDYRTERDAIIQRWYGGNLRWTRLVGQN